MMWTICFLAAFIAIVKSQGHGSLEIEIECLQNLNLTMEQVLPYVHIITDPSDKEGVGEFLACAWQGRKIIDKNGHVSSREIANYIIDIYSSLNLTHAQKRRIQEESRQCKKLKAPKLSTLAVKVKNCILITVDNVGFLTLPGVSSVEFEYPTTSLPNVP